MANKDIQLDRDAYQMVRETSGVSGPQHVSDAYQEGVQLWRPAMGRTEFEAKYNEVLLDPNPDERELFKTMSPDEQRTYADNYVREYARKMGREIID